jgi:Rrf2 family protein
MTATSPASPTPPATIIDVPLRVSAKADYALRALTEIAASSTGPITAQRIARAQAIPQGFLLNILSELRRAGLIRSHRGPAAGYELARPAGRITLAEIIAIIQRDLSRPAIEEITYPGAAGPLRDVWLAVRSSLSGVLGSVTLADIAADNLPQAVSALATQPYSVPESPPLDTGISGVALAASDSFATGIVQGAEQSDPE